MIKSLLLSHPGLKLAVAESLTGGHVQARVTSESGASGYFVGGLTAYTLERKVALLGVNGKAAAKCNSVSAAVARQMARGVCRLMKANIAVATTGFAEPDPTKGIESPRAHWAVCHVPKRGRVAYVDGYGEFPGADRTMVQTRVAEEAVAALERYLESV